MRQTDRGDRYRQKQGDRHRQWDRLTEETDTDRSRGTDTDSETD